MLDRDPDAPSCVQQAESVVSLLLDNPPLAYMVANPQPMCHYLPEPPWGLEPRAFAASAYGQPESQDGITIQPYSLCMVCRDEYGSACAYAVVGRAKSLSSAIRYVESATGMICQAHAIAPDVWTFEESTKVYAAPEPYDDWRT